jgi:SPP1 gp7 family putative phage head morphogenesis protein
MALPPEFEELPWEDFPQLREVVERWLKRQESILPIEQYRELLDVLKNSAFSAAKAFDQTTRERLFALLEKTLSEGMTVKEFREAAGPVLDSPWYADLVYRTNVANAQAAGQYAVEFGEDLGIWPYWRFDATIDSRNDDPTKCPSRMCRGLHGKVFRKSDAQARKLLPPCHFQCRCVANDVLADYKGTVSEGAAYTSRYPSPAGWDYDRIESLVPDIFRSLWQ